MRWTTLIWLSLVACGSPRTDEPVVTNSKVIINEVSSAGDDAVELVNRSTEPVDMTGWFIQDEDQVAEKTWAFPDGTTIAPGAYLVVRKDATRTFGLGSEDKVYLGDADGNVADVAGWAKDEALVSFCRRPNITGAFGACPTASFGVENPK
jgi:hypothetical protein